MTLPEYNSQDEGFITPVIMLNEDRWVVDVSQRRTMMKCQEMVASPVFATSGKSLVIGTQGGHVVILNFPDWALIGLGRRVSGPPE